MKGPASLSARFPHLSALACLLAAAGLLSGCTASFTMPDATGAALSNVSSGSLGAIQGNNYGGHAPLVGAHVFLLEGYTNGYGGAAKSLLKAGETAGPDFYGSTYPTAQDTTGSSTTNPTYGDYYVTTDSRGDFDLNNSYTCDAGYPVYIYAQGGNPQTIPSVNVTQINSYTDSNNKTVVVFTTSGTNLIYQGESVNFSTFTTGTGYDSFSGAQNQTVSPFYLTTNTVGFELGANITSSLPQGVAVSATISQATPISSNPAVVNLAVLGICPAGGGQPVTLTGASSSQSGGNLLVTFTNSGTNGLTPGEQVTFGTIPAPYAPFSGTTQTVSAIGLSSSQFGVLLGSGSNQASASFSSTATPVSPFSQLPFVYMNEVSTAAAAYALGGFFPTPGTTSLTGAGAGAVAANLSIPSGDAQALLGLQNAAITADQLYDIAGSNTGPGGDGETHISRTTTPGVAVYAATTSGSTTVTVGTSIGLQAGVTITGSGIPAGTTITSINTGVTPNTITLSAAATATATNVQLRAGAGNGTVPQTLLSTIGNILANCVDSNNTYNPYTGTGTTSTQCTSLFGYAKGGGTTGTTPVDTASAAIDIAHNPWANVSSLVGLPTGNQPFQPTLSSANDFAVGILYTPAHINNPEGIAVDAYGNVWYPNANGITAGGYVTTLTPFGGVLYNTVAATNQIPHYIAIDGNGYAWYGDSYNGTVVSVTGASVLRGSYNNAGTGLNQPYAIAIDGLYSTGYIYVEDLNSNGMDFFNGNGTSQGVVPEETTCLGGTYHSDHAAFDNANNGQNLWTSSEIGGIICKPIRTASTTYTSTSYAKYTLSPAASPNAIAIDYYGNAYIPANSTDEVVKVAAGAASGTTPTVLTGATLSSPFGVAVDGQGHIFVSNRTGNTISQFSSTAAVSAVGYTGSGTLAGTYFSDPLNISGSPQGAIWVTNYSGSRIVELLGVGAPTYTPLSLAANNNALGARP